MFDVAMIPDYFLINPKQNLNLAYLQSKTRTFVEILLFTTILHSQQSSYKGRNEKILLDIFLKPKEIPEMASGLRYFLKKVVSKTDIAGSEADQAVVKWGCRVAYDALSAMATHRNVTDE